MCDQIEMPNGRTVESIRSDGKCLCNSTEQEILHWIVQNVPSLSFNETLVIKRTPFGWEVKIVEVETCPPEMRL